jgi:sarcosine oxidase subunit beta
MAQCIATGRTPEIIEAFGLGRFGAGELVGEKGSAAVGH